MMNNMSINTIDFHEDDYARMDDRITEAMRGWRVQAIHKGSQVDIPGTWGASIYPYKYFEIYKNEGDVNPGEDENEIQCYLSCGWRGADDEVVIVLTVLGYDVLSGSSEVGAEIYKFGGDKMKVYRNNKLMTDFTKKFWWFFKRDTHKAWIKDVLA